MATFDSGRQRYSMNSTQVISGRSSGGATLAAQADLLKVS
jgi:hypothetical protein